jgi:protein O-GlcNAc transferase
MSWATTMGKFARRKGAQNKGSQHLGRGGGESHALESRARQAAGRGDAAAAMALYVELVKQGSMSPDVFSDLGALIAERGQLPAAVIQFEMALALSPHHENARSNLAKALETLSLAAFTAQRWTDAAVGYARLCELEPESPVFHNNAGAAFRQLGQPERALGYLQRACDLDGDRATVHYNLGSVLFDLANPDCEHALLRAIELAPEYVDAHVNLALVYFRLGRLDTAEDWLLRALSLDPEHGEAHGHLGSVLREAGRLPESLLHLRHAATRRPASVEIASNTLLARQADPGATAADLLAESREWAARFADALEPRAVDELSSAPAAEASSVEGVARKLRVGYVSADLRSHSVAKFIEPLFEAHDRASFELAVYSDGAPDETTRRLRSHVEAWTDTRSLDDAQLAERIASDGIDILVDLGGHTGSHRLLCFARRPAPVQVTYCGYPGTTGLTTMDWRLTDAVADPEAERDSHGTERLWRLPNGFLCFRPDSEAGAVAPSPAASSAAITFGSFNNLAKIGEPVLAVWARVLQAVPHSRLLMKARPLGEPRPQRRIRQCLESLGVAAERVQFIGYAATTAEHLALYARVDIGLDPFPYNGTTTTCEALWMGVPVVTSLGDRHAGRVGASLLSRVGLGDLVAATDEDYVRICARLAGDRGGLSHLRAQLRGRLETSPLVSPLTLARDIENAYRHFWQHRRGARAPLLRG